MLLETLYFLIDNTIEFKLVRIYQKGITKCSRSLPEVSWLPQVSE